MTDNQRVQKRVAPRRSEKKGQMNLCTNYFRTIQRVCRTVQLTMSQAITRDGPGGLRSNQARVVRSHIWRSLIATLIGEPAIERSGGAALSAICDGHSRLRVELFRGRVHR